MFLRAVSACRARSGHDRAGDCADEYFIAAYPESEYVDDARARVAELRDKLALKDYNSARLYFSLGSPQAARVYLDSVITEYPETDWARKALLDKATSLALEGADALAEESYRRLIELYPDSEEARSAEAALAGQAE